MTGAMQTHRYKHSDKSFAFLVFHHVKERPKRIDVQGCEDCSLMHWLGKLQQLLEFLRLCFAYSCSPFFGRLRCDCNHLIHTVSEVRFGDKAKRRTSGGVKAEGEYRREEGG